jgi:hypothetical protein
MTWSGRVKAGFQGAIRANLEGRDSNSFGFIYHKDLYSVDKKCLINFSCGPPYVDAKP